MQINLNKSTTASELFFPPLPPERPKTLKPKPSPERSKSTPLETEKLPGLFDSNRKVKSNLEMSSLSRAEARLIRTSFVDGPQKKHCKTITHPTSFPSI